MTPSARDAHWLPAPGDHRLPRPVLLPPRLDRSADLPVLPCTLLGLELLLQDDSIDLRRVSELVLSDLGATLHTFRLAGCQDSFQRMEDCLAGLDFITWFDALSAKTLHCAPCPLRTTEAWLHARLIAHYSRFVAQSLDNVSAEDAYLIGLFHELDSLPNVLGWTPLTGALSPVSLDSPLPPMLQRALSDSRDASESIWHFILHTAHDFAAVAPTPLIAFSSNS